MYGFLIIYCIYFLLSKIHSVIYWFYWALGGSYPRDCLEMSGLVGWEPQIRVKKSNKAGLKNMATWTEEPIIHKEITQ